MFDLTSLELATVCGGVDNSNSGDGKVTVQTPIGGYVAGEGKFANQWSNGTECRRGAFTEAMQQPSPAERQSTAKDLVRQCNAAFPMS